jgi:hypothetical protein
MPLRLRPFLLDVTSLSLSSLSVSTRPRGLFASFCCSSTTGETIEAFATRLDGVGWLSFLRLYGGRGMMRGAIEVMRGTRILSVSHHSASHRMSALQESTNPRLGLCYDAKRAESKSRIKVRWSQERQASQLRCSTQLQALLGAMLCVMNNEINALHIGKDTPCHVASTRPLQLRCAIPITTLQKR